MKTIIIIGIILLCITQLRIIIGSIMRLNEGSWKFKVVSIGELIITSFVLIVLIVTYFK